MHPYRTQIRVSGTAVSRTGGSSVGCAEHSVRTDNNANTVILINNIINIVSRLSAYASTQPHACDGGAAQLEVGYLMVSVSWPSAFNCTPCNHAPLKC